MNTEKEKQKNPVLSEALDFLSKEIDEWSKMSDGKMSDLDDSPLKVRPPVKVEPIGKLSWLNQAKKRLHKQWE